MIQTSHFLSSSKPDFYKVINELHNWINDTHKISYQDCNAVFTRALEDKQPVSDNQIAAAQAMEDIIKSVCPRRDTSSPDYKSIYDDFLNTVKEKGGPDVYIVFLRYVSLYLTGHLPHRIFIRLYINLIGKVPEDNPLMVGFPSFLTAIHFNSFNEVKKYFETKDEEIAMTIIICCTGNAATQEESQSLYKCFKLLAEGYITPVIARRWLESLGCPKDIIADIEHIKDFSLFHPSKIEPQYILCPSFSEVVTPETEASLFEQKGLFTRRKTAFEPVVFETIENQMNSTRLLIKQLAERTVVPVTQLTPFFGPKAEDVVRLLPKYAPIAVKRIAAVYESFLNNYKKLSDNVLQNLDPSDPEYRIAYKRAIKVQLDIQHLTGVPGRHRLSLGTQERLNQLHAFVDSFITLSFPEGQAAELIGKREEAVLNDESKPKAGTRSLVSFFVFLSELMRLTADVSLEGAAEAARNEGALKALYPNSPAQHLDMALIRVVRAVNRLQNRLFTREDAEAMGPLISGVWMESEGDELFVVVNTEISPFYEPPVQ